MISEVLIKIDQIASGQRELRTIMDELELRMKQIEISAASENVGHFFFDCQILFFH